jgi:hypothetical protein
MSAWLPLSTGVILTFMVEMFRRKRRGQPERSGWPLRIPPHAIPWCLNTPAAVVAEVGNSRAAGGAGCSSLAAEAVDDSRAAVVAAWLRRR